MTAVKSGGCPFGFDKHNQAPESVASTPIEALNAGNFSQAIKMIEDMVSKGTAKADDIERLAYAKLNIGDAAGSAAVYRQLLTQFPDSPNANHWREQASKAEITARNGVATLRPNGYEAYLQSRDPDQIAAHNIQSPHARVLVDEHWLEPGGYVPPIGLFQQAKNWMSGKVTDLLEPLGVGVHTALAFMDKPNKPGLWTRLPFYGALAALAHDRERLLESTKVPEGVVRDPNYKVPGYAKTGPTPDGSFANGRYPMAGAVGVPNPIHGPVDKKEDWSIDKRLPDPAKLAEAFGYRKGKMIEAPNLSAHVWAHLQQLVHDVMQTMPDDSAKYAVPSASGSAEQRLGIDKVFYRADARDEKYRDMNGVTGAWDMSHIYGSSIAQIDKARTDPATGDLVPGGKLFLRDGKWLPVETDANGNPAIVTGLNKNITMPLLAEHTLYARHHNWVCDVLKERHPEWHDNQIFQIARRVVTMTYVKIHTGAWTDTTFANKAVVEGLHANLYGRSERKKPFHQQRIFNPEGGNHPIADGLAGNRKITPQIEKPEQKGKYFAIAYRFAHAIVNDTFDKASFKIGKPGEKVVKSGEDVNIQELRDLDAQAFIEQHGLGSIYHGLMNTVMGAPVINNYADMFNRMPTEEGVLDLFQAEIAKDRQRGVGSYQQYRTDHYLPEITSYRDLFKDPDSAESQKTIAKLEELYGEINAATGKVNLDSMLGLLMNENRPKGFAITNEGFQTFVLEASTRIMRQAMLTTNWHPNDVGWTAINLVEAISKEKLIAMHTTENPEMFAYLKDRKKPISFNDMSSDEKSPLEEFMDFSGEHFFDVGLGDPWKEEHFTGKGLENSYVTRITHEATGKTFVVDVTDGSIYEDRDGDGRIRARDAIAGNPEGCTREELFKAATDIRDSHAVAWPGARAASSPGFTSGWRLSESEVRKLKQWKADKKDEGVAGKLTDLQVHTLVFNLAGSVDEASFQENLDGWKALEKSGIVATAMAFASTMKFGDMMTMRIGTGEAMKDHRPTKSTKIFDANGNIDQERLGFFRKQVVELAAKSPDGRISEDAFMGMLKQNDAVGFTTGRQWNSFFRLLERIGGSRTISPQDFDDMFNGKLLINAFEKFATPDIVAKLDTNKVKRCPVTGAVASN